MNSRVAALIAALFAVVFSAATVGAQETSTPVPPPPATPGAIRFTDLTLSIWPEFDQPAGLVFLAGDLAPDVALPATLTFTIPAQAGDPTAVATGNPPRDVQWSKSTVPGGTAITFQTNDRFIELDFYLPMDLTTSTRNLVYTWPGEIAADTFTIEVQQPFGATGLVTDPQLPPSVTGQFGLQYHRQTMKNVVPGNPIKIAVTYTKTDSRTTFDALGLQRTEPGTTSGGGGGPSTTTLALIVLVGVIIAGGTVWYFIQRRPQMVAATAAKQAARPGAEVEPPAAVRRNGSGRSGFCTQCGEPSEPEDRFCSHCGARLRRTANT